MDIFKTIAVCETFDSTNAMDIYNKISKTNAFLTEQARKVPIVRYIHFCAYNCKSLDCNHARDYEIKNCLCGIKIANDILRLTKDEMRWKYYGTHDDCKKRIRVCYAYHVTTRDTNANNDTFECYCGKKIKRFVEV